jgi:antitoxin HicB
MRYPIKLEPDTGGYVVSFPDIPEALTQGDTKEEALSMGLDALVTALDFYFEENRKVPEPSPITGDYVELPLSVASKVLLLNAFIEADISQVELASLMGIKKQEVTRLLDLHHSTKIDTIQHALNALMRPMSVDYINQIDIYGVIDGSYQLPHAMNKGEEINFAGSYAAEPGKIRKFSGVLAGFEAEESSFVVVKDIHEVDCCGLEGIKFSQVPIASVISKYIALSVNCMLPSG